MFPQNKSNNPLMCAAANGHFQLVCHLSEHHKCKVDPKTLVGCWLTCTLSCMHGVHTHTHSAFTLTHTRNAFTLTHTHSQCIHTHSHSQCIHTHSHSQCIHTHSHSQCIHTHSHSLTMHSHSLTLTVHSHSLTVHSHSHSHSQCIHTHSHSLTVRSHSHSQSHSHSLALTYSHSHSLELTHSAFTLTLTYRAFGRSSHLFRCNLCALGIYVGATLHMWCLVQRISLLTVHYIAVCGCPSCQQTEAHVTSCEVPRFPTPGSLTLF